MSDQTRRDWIVTIGHAAVGWGVAERALGGAEYPAPLPPGVYEPSTAHLGHALMSAERYHPIPAGCPTEYVSAASGLYPPVFFSKSEFLVICRFVGLLLNEPSDGAGVCQEVAEWVDLRVLSAQAASEAEAHLDPLHRALAIAYAGAAKPPGIAAHQPPSICHDGLRWLSSAAESRYAADFLALDGQRQVALLHSMSDERAGKQEETPGTRFFAFLKAETIRGFYTSRAGLQELDFKGNAFYARSPGCAAH